MIIDSRCLISSPVCCAWEPSLPQKLKAISRSCSLTLQKEEHTLSLKYKPAEEEDSVIPTRIAPCAVVVCPGAVESPITRVLDSKIDVLLGPPRKIQNVPVAMRTSVGAAKNGSLRVKQRVRRPRNVKQANCPRQFRTVVVLDIALHRVEMVA